MKHLSKFFGEAALRGVSLKRVCFAFALFTVHCALLTAPSSALALTLSLDTVQEAYGPGDTFVVTVRADDVGLDECFNAGEVTLEYPKGLLNAVAVAKGESLFTLWPEEPTVDRENGRVHFIGGVPAGYCGRVLGDPGRTNILAKVVFSIPGFMVGGTQVETDTLFRISITPESKILLNDGAGTPAQATTLPLELTRLLVSRGAGNEWLTEVRADTMPPDPFTPEVRSEKNTFAGKYFLVFAAVDKQSGVDHYEVSEEDPLHPGYLRGTRYDAAHPVNVTSPYQLKDQELHSTVVVTAVDAAGNKRTVTLPPPAGTSTPLIGTSSLPSMWAWWAAGIVAGAALLGAVWWFVRRRSVNSEQCAVSSVQ